MRRDSEMSRRVLLRATAGLALGGAAAAALAACGDPPMTADAESAESGVAPPAAARLAGDPFARVAGRAREASGDIGTLDPAPGGDPNVTLTLPPEIAASRAPEIVSNDSHASQVRFWRNIGWKTNFDISLVSFDEILSGGVPRDGIPPIDNPRFVDFTEANAWVEEREPVIALAVNGEARAYPLQILTFHEIVNDVVGGIPVAVTFCPLCNSSVVFDRTVLGETLRFGVSGNLRNSDLIMWDDKSETWWQQLTGEAIVGDLVGIELDFLASQLISYLEFKESFPTGLVLSRDTGHVRDYGRNPYVGYDSIDESPFLFSGPLDGRLRSTARVVAVQNDAESVAYPFDALAKVRVVNDRVGGDPIVVLWTPDTASALRESRIGSAGAVGSGVAFGREVDGRELTFQLRDGEFQDVETESTWSISGRATAGPLAGTRLPDLVHANHFWFAWAAFRPDTRIWSPA